MAALDDIMKQAQIMQEKLKSAQEEITSIEVIGMAGAGLVKVVMNGRHELKRVMIDPTLFYLKQNSDEDGGGEGGTDGGSQSFKPKNHDESRQMIQELVAAAVNDAVRKIEDQSREKMASLAEGMPPLPEDFKLPSA